MQKIFSTLMHVAFCEDAQNVVPLSGDGSGRRYFRVTSSARTAIGVLGPDQEENAAFLAYSRAMHAAGLPVPKVYAEGGSLHSGDATAPLAYLVEDFGDETLFSRLTLLRNRTGERMPAAAMDIYREAVCQLPRFQFDAHSVVPYEKAYPHSAFDRTSISWDLQYWRNMFVRLAGVRVNEGRLERDFVALTDFLLAADCDHFLYRDFQSRNIMVKPDGSLGFIDYQGGRRGALHYDIASLLYDAKADLAPEAREFLLSTYMDAVSERTRIDRDAFRRTYFAYVLVRIMQAMGAYGYRGFFERKTLFLQSVPYAMNNIRRILEDGVLPLSLPEIESVFHRLMDDPRFTSARTVAANTLHVHVGSFSYRNGIPADRSAHGGGFVFDCRPLENPVYVDGLRDLNGKDAPVRAFLQGQEDARVFLSHACALADAAVRSYLARGYDSLSIECGCRGGQHRSVYIAEAIASHLSATFPAAAVDIDIHHREQASWPRPSEPAMTPTRAGAGVS